jgi:glutathione S-transferase
MTTFYYAPGACSLGIHVLLEEVGAPYEAVAVNLKEGEQFKPGFVAVTPKSKVPVLVRDDGSVLTEYPAIAYWLAASTPAAKLLPSSPEGVTRALEATDYCVASLHMQGFSRMFRPTNFGPTESDGDAIKARGQQIFEKGMAWFEDKLAKQDWVAGEYSFADSALYYVCFWWVGRFGKELPPKVAAHYERMKARPAVQRAMAAEGLA